MKDKPSIVFVDDQSNVLQGFRRALRSLEEVWDIHYSTGGKETLRLMESTPVDIIVCDTNMPGMRGTELLKEVQTLHPAAIRLVLSGGGSRSDDISTLLRTSHQFFSKPFDTEKLKQTVEHLLDLRDKLNDDGLKKLVAGLSKLPCSPYIYDVFRKEREGSSSDLDKMGAFIAQDPGLTAKMLQSLNSAFFGVNKAGIHPFKAAQSMGPGTIAYLFDDDSHNHTIASSHPNYNFLSAAYKESLHCAYLVEALATAENMPEALKNIAYSTGMMGNAGAIILAYELTDAYAKLVPGFKTRAAQAQAEKKALGATHNTVGAYFLALWGFPAATTRAVTYGLTPEKDPDQSLNLTTLLHVAQALAQTDDLAEQKSLMNMPHLEKLGLADKLQKWHDLDKDEVRTQAVLRNWKFA
jgi:HD-like signal output (HDOD) protein